MDKMYSVETPYITSTLNLKKVIDRFKLCGEARRAFNMLTVGKSLTIGKTVITRTE